MVSRVFCPKCKKEMRVKENGVEFDGCLGDSFKCPTCKNEAAVVFR